MITHPHQIEQQNNLVVATIKSREVTPLQMQELINDLMMRMRYDNAQHFVLDVSAVSFISSGCLGSLVGFLQELEHVRGKIGLVGCTADVLFLFKVTRLDSVFGIFDDIDEAKADFKAH